jgi:NAD(P)-dependent dehydrogenase (short-subunit alcohol dehydrogenase family)
MSDKTDMTGKTCMITGSNSGIGKDTAIGLAEMGATIMMACRNEEKAKLAMEEIIEKTGNSSIELFLVDLSSQKQIHDLGRKYGEKNEKLDVLINNAGIVMHKRTLTVDGIEMTLAVNVLAPFLLSHVLLGVLKSSAPSRIINVSSALHNYASMKFDNLQGEKSYTPFGVYNMSKLALNLITFEFAKKLEGTGVTMNCLHPGIIRSNLGRDMPLYYRWAQLFFRSPKQGARTSIYLASSPNVEGVNGKYFKNRKEAKASRESYNEENAKRLWQTCVELTNLQDSFRNLKKK